MAPRRSPRWGGGSAMHMSGRYHAQLVVQALLAHPAIAALGVLGLHRGLHRSVRPPPGGRVGQRLLLGGLGGPGGQGSGQAVPSTSRRAVAAAAAGGVHVAAATALAVLAIMVVSLVASAAAVTTRSGSGIW